MKYNLTFWQKASLPFIWLVWITGPIEVRKTWHEVKKGMEPHKHKFGKVYYERGYPYRNCLHEGCNIVSICDDNGELL